MKPSRSLLLLAMVATAAFAGQAHAEERIAFINMDRVFSEYTKTKAAEDRLKEQANLFREQTEARMEELQDLEEDFALARQEAQDMALSEDMRKQRRADAEEKLVQMRQKETEVRTFTEQRRRELENTSRRLRETIVGEITVVLEEYAKERDFIAVLDSSGNSFNQIPVILYRRETMDITGFVLEKLNTAARSSAPIALPQE